MQSWELEEKRVLSQKVGPALQTGNLPLRSVPVPTKSDYMGSGTW